MHSVLSLSEHVSGMLARRELDGGLRVISDFVERIFTEPLCTAQVFGSRTLDELCQRIGALNLEEIGSDVAGPPTAGNEPGVIVYIVTRIQRSGGHTRVIEDFIRARPTARHIILSTDLCGRSDADHMSSGMAGQANLTIEQAPKGSYLQRLSWLQTRLLKMRPGKVYLLNHHQDSVAVAAIQPEMGLDASFCHHGDHHLCLGMYVPHLRHIDFHPMGFHNCRNVLGIANVYIPLTAEDKGVRAYPFMPDGRLTTCTAGRSNKIEIPYFLSYTELLPRLLSITGGRHIHIGRLTPWALFKIRKGLKLLGVGMDRFVYIPWVPSVWKALHDHKVDLYIASFPYGGALTSVEVMGAGIPIALHRHAFSRMMGGTDMVYDGAFSWRYPDELLDYCTSLTVDALEEAGRLGRERYEAFHHPAILRGIIENDAPLPEACGMQGDFAIEYDEWAAWMANQVSARRVLARAVYRIFRRVRTWRIFD
ncbi:MAG: hypothetical protein IPM27_11740 [Nitrosomonadales bacterium]|nr:hypothetical protein [Nitrosomonadales bacterium]